MYTAPGSLAVTNISVSVVTAVTYATNKATGVAGALRHQGYTRERGEVGGGEGGGIAQLAVCWAHCPA